LNSVIILFSILDEAEEFDYADYYEDEISSDEHEKPYVENLMEQEAEISFTPALMAVSILIAIFN
jgi:murein tripeptide amidase MpaA